jgi:uncharacterized protein
MRLVIIFSLGSTFGLGVYLAGMTEPGKVLAFLDIAGLWDPSLAFVMGGAIAVGLAAFRLASKREKSLLGYPVSRPSTLEVDRSLLAGAMIFGVGWGLSGVCPGPAIFNLGLFDSRALLFFLAMISGMALERALPLLLTLSNVPTVEQDG